MDEVKNENKVKEEKIINEVKNENKVKEEKIINEEKPVETSEVLKEENIEENSEKEEAKSEEGPVQGEVVEEVFDPFDNAMDDIVKEIENIIAKENEQFPNLFEDNEEFKKIEDKNFNSNDDLYYTFRKNIGYTNKNEELESSNSSFENTNVPEEVNREDDEDFDFMKMFRTPKDNYEDEYEEDSDLIKHAKNEFVYAGWVDQNGRFYDEIQERICYDILDILKVISDQGHSGSSIGYLMHILNILVKYRSITPLTGESDEWDEPYGLNFCVNKRDPRVIKYNDGTCVFTDGKIFVDKNGAEYLDGKNSYVVIKSFPYMPESEYVYVNEERDKI